VLDFRPPKDSPILISLIKLALPLYLKFKLHDTYLEPLPGALQRFSPCSGKRGMICPNHANRHDPHVMFAFSKLVNEDFNFVAAREVFDWDNGRNGWWLQHLGAFSVVRGAADRESFKTSRRIISEGKKKLVLFPEGEISRQNDTLLPLESGAAQLCFWAVDDFEKNKSGENGLSDAIYLIPIALKYTFPTDIQPALKRTLTILEEKLGLPKAGEQSLNERLGAISRTLLQTLESEYNFKSSPSQSVDERVRCLRAHILQVAASQLHISLPETDKQLDWVRTIRNYLDDFIYNDSAPKSEYQQKIHEEKAAIIRGFYRDLERVVNFISIYESYVREHNTQERFADILERLEVEVLGGEPSFKGPRKVLIDVGNPINISDHYSEYKRDKRATLRKITEELQDQLATMLGTLEGARTPVLVD
jgi:1-acyl-sn-glycerol-3-phosphate acyltransferase